VIIILSKQVLSVSLLNIDAGLKHVGNKMLAKLQHWSLNIWSHFVMMLESDSDVQQIVAGV
jgi:hypothetical protein